MIAQAPRVVLTYGTFDALTPAHARFLSTARALGHLLIVGCRTAHSSTLPQPLVPFADRVGMLEMCRYVDRIIPWQSNDQIRTDIVNYNATALAMGHEDSGCFDELQDIAQVHYLVRPLRPKMQPLRVYSA